MSRLAACACGQLGIECTGEPAMVALCHCRDCQRRTGSTYGVAAFFARAEVAPKGMARSFTRQSDSGHPITFHFCPDCGSTVYWEPSRRPELVVVAVGAFAEPAFPAPTRAVFEQHRHPWVTVSTGGA